MSLTLYAISSCRDFAHARSANRAHNAPRLIYIRGSSRVSPLIPTIKRSHPSHAFVRHGHVARGGTRKHEGIVFFYFLREIEACIQNILSRYAKVDGEKGRRGRKRGIGCRIFSREGNTMRLDSSRLTQGWKGVERNSVARIMSRREKLIYIPGAVDRHLPIPGSCDQVCLGPRE